MKKDWTLVQAVSILKMRVSRSPSAAPFRPGPGSCLFRHRLTLSGIQTSAFDPFALVAGLSLGYEDKIMLDADTWRFH